MTEFLIHLNFWNRDKLLFLSNTKKNEAPFEQYRKMSLNNYKVQIATAYPPVREVSTQRGTTFRADIHTEERIRKKAYLKLLKTEDVAKEILCATLARKLHLPIKQAYYVNVDPSFVQGKSGNIHNLAFGLEEDIFPARHLTSIQLSTEILKWSSAVVCAVFDEWIVNGDRLPKNLMFVSNGEYWLIDHDEALPKSAQVACYSNSSLLQLLSKDMSEIELYGLRRKAIGFIQEYMEIDWEEILDLVCYKELHSSPIYFLDHIEFLRKRAALMEQVITKSLGIRQQEMNFSVKEKSNNGSKK